MGIKTGSYNVDAGVSAGFVKTDGSGDFLFGEPGGGGGGVGTGWQLIEVKDITVDATTVTFSGLDGDADGEYMLLFRFRTSQALEAFYTIEPNGISANQNTIRQIIIATGVSTATFPTLLLASAGTNTDKQWIGIAYFDAKTGTTARQIISDSNTRLTNLTIAAGGLRRATFAGSWDDTTTNITSLDIVCDIANGIGSGSQLCLYKKTAANVGGGLQLIETKDITVATNSITFSGLDGDTDLVYKLVYDFIGVGVGVTNYTLRPNGITTSQGSIRHNFSSAGTHDVASFADLRFATIGTAHTGGELMFHAETGRRRVYHAAHTGGGVVSGATAGVTARQWYGTWDETVTNITSLEIFASTASGIPIGSKWSLYRLTR